MPINKRNRSFQVKVRDRNGSWLTGTCSTKKEAQALERQLIEQTNRGLTQSKKRLTVDQFFIKREQVTPASVGWRERRIQMYRDYVSPFIGHMKVCEVQPHDIQVVLRSMVDQGRGPQTQKHVFNLLRATFKDAVETYRVVLFNPVLPKFSPKIPKKESAFLKVEDLKVLLAYVKGHELDTAVWLQAFLGLRVGEVSYLRWSAIDFENETLSILGTYSRNDKREKDHPKGGSQVVLPIPKPLLTHLKEAKLRSGSEYVVSSRCGGRANYDRYLRVLKGYCRNLELPAIGTHTLRHSCTELWCEFGATQDEIRELLNHSSRKVTDRYIHGTKQSLAAISQKMDDMTLVSS